MYMLNIRYAGSLYLHVYILLVCSQQQIAGILTQLTKKTLIQKVNNKGYLKLRNHKKGVETITIFTVS